MDKTQELEIKRYIPNIELKNFIKKHLEKKFPKKPTKTSLIEDLKILIKTNPAIQLELDELIKNYKYIGKTSISWSRPKNVSSFSKEIIEESIIKYLKNNPFKKELRPKPDNQPKVNKVFWINDEKLVLDYAYTNRPQIIEEDYVLRELSQTRHATALIRILNSPIIIEVRTDFQLAKRIHMDIANLLNVQSNLIEFSQREINLIKAELHALKKGARHKKLAGDFDTVEVNVAPTLPDLDNSNEYQNLLGNDELKRARYKFNNSIGGTLNQEITYNIYPKGSIWFMSDISEEVIENILSIIRRIKGF